ncbi:MAG: hypothetical protein ACJAWP_001051 [Porticoccus sp.]|jgi:hypothetical protein|uniref:DUF3649 domain-containing protein n=1 Tax=Porticoccus sp. TaxID=2024853 RepID=UPI0039E33BE6|tara:strand:- start:97080 stop:97382 length:303 start_codon:yes stop_codon:yes gene_type:complete
MMAALNSTARYRWMVASRVLASVVGGYALTSAATVLLALIWPLPQAEAVAAATMLSFTLYTGVILWIFAVKRLRTLWLGLVIATAFCAGLSWVLLPGGVA